VDHRNGDLHAKNIAVLHDIRPGRLGSEPGYEGARYAPLYDLLNTRVVLRDDLFALPLDGKQNGLRRKDLALLARRGPLSAVAGRRTPNA